MGAFDVEDDGRMRVARLNQYSRAVNVVVRVIDKTELRDVVTRADDVHHRVCEVLVADETGAVYLSLWDEHVDKVERGQVLAVSNAYMNAFRGSARLNLGKYGGFKVLDEAPFGDVNLENNLSANPVGSDASGGGYRRGSRY